MMTTIDGCKLFWKNRKGRREGRVALYLKEKFEHMVVSYGDHESCIECLWIKIRGIVTKGDLMLGNLPIRMTRPTKPYFVCSRKS